MELESDGYTNCNRCSYYNHQRTGTRTGGLGNKRISGDHPNYSIIEIGQDTEKSPVDVRRLEETCSYLNSSQKPLANAGEKNYKKSNNKFHKSP